MLDRGMLMMMIVKGKKGTVIMMMMMMAVMMTSVRTNIVSSLYKSFFLPSYGASGFK